MPLPRQAVSEPEARLGQLGIGRDGPPRVALRDLELARIRLEGKSHGVNRREPGQGGSVRGIGAGRLLEESARLVECPLFEPVEEPAAPRVTLVDVDAGSRPDGRRRAAGPQLLRGGSGEPILHREHPVEIAVELLGRHDFAGHAVGQLRRDAQADADALVGARQDPPAAQEPPELRSDAARLRQRLRHFRARHERDSGKPPEVGGEALGEPAADPVVVDVAREIAEIQDRDRIREGRRQLAGPESSQIRKEGGGRRITPLRVAGESAGQYDPRLRRDARRAQGLDVGRQDRRDPIRRSVAGKRGPPGQGFVEDGAEREQVRPLVERVAPKLLGRHVPESADHGAGRRQRHFGRGFARALPFPQLRDPEVEQLAEVVAGDHDVLRLDVAVEDSGRVRVDEGFEERGRQGQGLGKRERAAPEPVAERLAGDELHGQKRGAVGLARFEEGGDGRVLQPGAGLRFAQEPRACLGGQRVRKHLDRGHPAQGQVAGEKHLAHSPGAEAPLDEVVSERPADHASPEQADFSRIRAAIAAVRDLSIGPLRDDVGVCRVAEAVVGTETITVLRVG